VGASIVAFASTNVDDIFVLLAFLGDPTLKRKHVVAGQYLGIGALVIASAALAAAAVQLPEDATRWLGVLPVLVGLRKLWALWRGENDDDETGGKSGLLQVALVTVSNGGDNVAVYVPLLAKIGISGFAILSGVFAVK
jgi:cadmium resistance protein CadD (predicted permease)